MKTITSLALAAAMLLPAWALAQSPTHAGVQAPLVQAQPGALTFAAPSPTLEFGGVPAGSQQTGGPAHDLPMPDGNPNCVGPVSFCRIFGGA
jgi:hypothetical protein